MADAPTIKHRPEGLPVRSLRVEVLSGPDAGRTSLAKSDTLSIGTAETNDLQLSDETVSRYHLELKHQHGRIWVRDLDSTNGTLAGPATLGQATIEAGTVLRLGKTQIRVSDGETVTLEMHDDDRFADVRGQSATMRALMAKADRVAKTDASVLLYGETGTGKEVLARAIHASSKRAAGPFETVDCGSLLPTLVASELFGHEAGAFTGAQKQHVGAFERAHGGTLFLDEIGELSSALQPILLGALERRAFRRVGGSQTISIDVRLICATNRDLREEVNAGTFREDLFYRIGVVLLALPPLRARAGDIPILAEHFAREAGYDGALHELIGHKEIEALKAHRWPGNVRELRNFVEAALAMGEAPALVRGDRGLGGSAGGFSSLSIDELLEMSFKDARRSVLDEFETQYLKAVIERSEGNTAHAARRAQMNRSYLVDLLKRRGLK